MIWKAAYNVSMIERRTSTENRHLMAIRQILGATGVGILCWLRTQATEQMLNSLDECHRGPQPDNSFVQCRSS
jgi:hypothetical protein